MLATILAAGILTPGSTEITIYNQGLGFVKDVRTVSLRKGSQDVVIDDVAQQIDATSVGLKCLNNPGSVSVLEQNYQFDLISPNAILNKSVGKRVRFTRTVGTKKETLEGVLLSAPTTIVSAGNGSEGTYNGLVIKADDGRIILSPEGEVDVLDLPGGLISKPSLLWQVDSSVDQDAKMELSYLTGGMSWSANYVLTLGSQGTGDLKGWVTLNNQSGLSFQDAKLKLLAGEVNLADERQVQGRFRDGVVSSLKAKSENDFKEEGFFEYHLYTLQRPATVKNKEVKQLSLLEGFNIPIRKVLTFHNYAYAGEGAYNNADQAAAVSLKFVNDQKSHLGMPLPAGKMRFFQRDAAGSLQFLGEDQIKHTPKDEKLSLNIGKAFDLKGSHKRTSYTKLSKSSSRSSYEVEVRNRKKTAETVYVYEHLSGSWKVTAKSNDFVKEDSNTIVFEVKLKAGETKTVKYTVDSKY